MSNFTTAATARKMTESARSDKETNEIVKTVLDLVEANALEGKCGLTIDKNNWSKDGVKLSDGAVKTLKGLGYSIENTKITRNNPDNHNQPYDVDVVRIKL